MGVFTTEKMIEIGIVILVISALLSVCALIKGLYCKYHPSPVFDDMCFSPELRCEIECANYNRNFTGIIDVDSCFCCCDCGDIWVSACSGFAFPKGQGGAIEDGR